METKQRKYDKQDDPYNAWIRTVPALSSHTGVRAYDVDLCVWHTDTLYFAHIETKTGSTYPPPHQILTMQMTRIAFETADKEVIKSYLDTKPYIAKDKELVYRGYFFLQYEKNNINDGSASIQLLQQNGFSEKMIIRNDKQLLWFTQNVLGIPTSSSKA